MRRLWWALLVFLVAAQLVNADVNEPNDPNELLRAKWDAVVSVLRMKNVEQKAKEKEIEKIVSPIFDFPLMAKLALGKKHWPKFTPAEFEKFTQLFTERLKASYREKITLYEDEQASFKPAVQRKNAIYIPMELTSRDESVTIIYKLRMVDESRKVKVGEGWEFKTEKRWKVYDVEIQGVSIIQTYRSQFDDILRRSTVEDLLS
ncbi:MAG: MlaC/ttg2D family ABC transporter substrate-binding protein, partial [Planctomycetota bacterium]